MCVEWPFHSCRHPMRERKREVVREKESEGDGEMVRESCVCV